MSATPPLSRLLPRRRTVLRALFALAVSAFTGGTLAHVATTPGAGAGRTGEARAGGPGGGFDEMYRGRRIQGRPVAGARFDVRVDGRPLHLMRCADGGYLTPVDHYASYPTPLAAARGAVDEMGSARLALGAHHGVRP
ncbi:tyrosinase family oxidase copper chaperone [Streptomyces sp. NPDC047821]|uniref:tyrosinase family oxidase copper chaperone n=1 Tax=Streptomyces sp. NPDC047821 TaxID=3365488 RepID=UPI003713F91C